MFWETSKSTKEFKEEVYDLVGDEYEVIGEYVNSQEKIMMRHNVCGCEYPVLPSMFYIEVAVRIVLEMRRKQQSNLNKKYMIWLAMNIQ